MGRRVMALTVVMALITILLMPGVIFAAGEELSWVGCGITRKAFMDKMVDEYTKETGVKINVQQNGTATAGIREVAKGAADMGGSCRHVLPLPEERDAKLVHVAWDALVVIVHPSNPVGDISADNLRAVFEGRITNWKELGGPDMKLQAVARKGKTSGVGLMIRELLFKNPDFEFSSSAIELKSSGDVEKYVEQEKDAIAFTGVSSAKKRKVKMMSINGKQPNPENIASGDYILYRPLYLVTSRTPSADVDKFINFVKGAKGQRIISDEGIVNLEQGAKLWEKYRNSMKEARVNEGF